MIKKLKRNQTWVSIVLLLVVFFGLGSLLIPQGKTEYPEFVTKSPSPTGTKAFYTFLKDEQGSVQVWQRPVDLLPNNAGQLMILIEPDYMFNQEEQDKWIKWLERGNRIFLISRAPDGFFNIKTVIKGPSDSENSIQSASGQTYQASVETQFRLQLGLGDEAILQDKQGTIALKRVIGQGELTVLVTPEWLQNENILNNDHLKLVLPLLGGANAVWFNEYIHGSESKLTLIEAYPQWFLLLFAQLALVILLWLWSKGMRFGPVETPRESVVRFGDERIKAQAAWYQKGEFYKETLLHQIDYVKMIIQERWGISANTVETDYIELTKRRLPKNKQGQWEQNWAEIAAITNTAKVTHKQFLAWSKLIDEVRKQVQEG
ncbi:DUF4350 domain-containing protein [Pseudoneobacillus sp. C159]